MNITPALHVRNEEYWIGYVLRNLLKVFPQTILYDTGSTDNTVTIAKEVAARPGMGRLVLIQENLGGDAHKIGNCPNVLRQMVDTDWMLLVDGDEIWGEPQLRALMTIEPPAGAKVGFCNGRNLAFVNNRLMEREGFAADRLFAKDVRWNKRTDYPFQSHGLEKKVAAGQVFYSNFEQSYFWHVRHLRRSSQEHAAYFRNAKKDYFKLNPASLRELPVDWLGEIEQWPNLYLG